MTIKFKKFNRKELPFNNEMLSFWNKNGFLVIDQFYSNLECDDIRNRAKELVHNFNPYSIQSIFDTTNQDHAEDKYFLESGDKIHFFFEKNSFDKDKIVNI